AGHCNRDVTEVVIGTTDHVAGDGEVIAVDQTIAHPDFWTTFDVALLHLAEEAVTPPRMLAMDCVVERHLFDGAEVAIVGYGATDAKAQDWDTKLVEAYTTIDDSDCSDLSRGCNSAVSPGGELIAGGDGVDSCNGDSGGPLYLITEEGNFLVGITSRAAVPSTVPCGDGGIYVRVDALVDWIEETTGEELPRPDCSDIPNRSPEPTAEPIELSSGWGWTTVVPNDPDGWNDHSFMVIDEPAFGGLTWSKGGDVYYMAYGPFFSRDDSFIVEVTDDGNPALSGQVEVVVEWTGNGGSSEEPKACGCQSPAMPVGYLPLLVWGFAWRRQSC
ncbi:MAG: trypsin-like serine protease, partial [Proteobacteria bacterium]|nr:trypsin-like serine protease [Pseudomonadota bacterium]